MLARLDDRAALLKECPACGACYDAGADRCVADGHALVLSLPVRRLVDSRYRLDRLIGKGGMGAVYEARDLQLERLVAVKIMLGRSFGDQRTLRRFRHEARAAAQLNHPNIVAVYDVGRLEAEGAYLVMERVHGVTLRAELQRGPLRPRVVAEWFDQMLAGVSAAHGRGIVHRDLKPENVIGTSAGDRPFVVKILDFGLAKLAPDATLATGTMTSDGAVMGTLGYMAPEQLLGQQVDHRADIFAVGVMLAETLTGRRPFEGAGYSDFVQAALRGEYHLPGTSAEIRRVDDLLQQCLARDPQNRAASAADLWQLLGPALRALSE